MRGITALVFLLVLTACTGPAEPENRALSLAQEVERLAALRALWPGFEPMEIPLAIYDGERTWLFRHPSPPTGFSPVADPERSFHAYEGRHPAVVANTSADLGGTQTATLVLEGSAPGRSLTDLAAVALHEAFHVYQREHHPGWQANEADLFLYPLDDASLLSLRRHETEALRRALAAPDDSAAACWADRALAVRAERFAGMNPAFAAYERGTELNEGLASYVQLRAAGGKTLTLPGSGFPAVEIRLRAYTTGPALALLLDRFQAGWQNEFEAGNGESLDQFLRTSLEAGGWPSEECAFSVAERDSASATAREDVAAVLAQRVERREVFDTLPGWRVVVQAAAGEPLSLQGFDPLNVERIEGGILHLRLLQLGNDSGKIEILDSPQADLQSLTEAAGPHPLFNGVRRLVIAGLAQPEVTAQDGHVTVEAAGLMASFQGASVVHGQDEVVVALAD